MDEIRALVRIQFPLIASVSANIALIAFIPPTSPRQRVGAAVILSSRMTTSWSSRPADSVAGAVYGLNGTQK